MLMHGCVVWSYPTFPVLFREHSTKTILSCLRLAFKPTVAKQSQNSSFLCPKCIVFLCVYSYFKTGCGKKCKRESRKVLWVVLISLFLKGIWKNGTRGMDVSLRVLKESNKSRFDRYSVRSSILIISHITFRDSPAHILRQPISK